MKTYTCKHCTKEFESGSKKPPKFCSDSCRKNNKIEQKFAGKIEGYHYVICPVCEQKTKQINNVHAAMHGFSSPRELADKFGVELTCQEIKENNSGENNPAFRHGGKYSKWSKNFIHGYVPEAHERFSRTHSKRRNDKSQKHKYMTNIEYWLNEFEGDEEKAKQAYTEFQTRDLNYFVNKYGAEEGRNRHALKIQRWSKSFKKCNFSKISQELFDAIVLHLDDKDNIYYATFDREDKRSYQNKEYHLDLGETTIRPDFIDVNKKKIIEFDGEYWHSEARANPAREKRRDEMIVKNGYQVLHVHERNYKQNKDKVIQECLNFLRT